MPYVIFHIFYLRDSKSIICPDLPVGGVIDFDCVGLIPINRDSVLLTLQDIAVY